MLIIASVYFYYILIRSFSHICTGGEARVTKGGEEDEFHVVAQTTRKNPPSDRITLPTEALDIGSEPGFV